MRPILLSAGLFVALAVGRPASADIIVDQPANLFGGIVSQHYTDVATLTSQAFDDFALSGSYHLNALTVYGIDFGNSSNTAVTAQILSAPGFGSPVLLSATGSESGGNLSFNFGGALLGPGTFWLTAFVDRPSTSGQWSWHFHLPSTGGVATWQNPGGGFGLGTSLINLTAGTNQTPTDMAFRLEGTPVTTAVPAPPAIILVGAGLATGFSARRIRRLFGVAQPA